jgi:pimeloyl-ACP methyl ester carboxylesterase
MESESRRLLENELYPAKFDDVSARFITLASGLRVRVVEAGVSNPDPVVLVPGWGCGAWIFHEIIPHLALSGFHAIAVELKGHGLSDKPDDPREFTSESMRDNLGEILDALGLDCTALIGHSMGAAVAVELAAVAPHRVSSLVLAAPVGFAGVQGMGIFRFITPGFALPILQMLTSRFLIRAMLSVVYGSIRKASERDVAEFYAPTRLPGFVRSMRYLLHEFDWQRPFPALDVPMMTVFGNEDVLSPAHNAERYGGKPTIIVEGAGHVLFDEAPGILNGAIAGFLRERAYISTENEEIES